MPLARGPLLPGWGYPSSSLPNDLGRVHRVKAKPPRGRFASPDTAPTSEVWQLQHGREDQEAVDNHAPNDA